MKGFVCIIDPIGHDLDDKLLRALAGLKCQRARNGNVVEARGGCIQRHEGGLSRAVFHGHDFVGRSVERHNKYSVAPFLHRNNSI